MVHVLYGKPVRDSIKANLVERIGRLSFVPELVIFQVGDRDDSNIYINNKKKFGEEIGAKIRHIKLDESVEERVLIEEVKKMNNEESVSGIIIQLPLPKNMDTEKILSFISKEKDADGLREVGGENEEIFVTPATARAVENILDFYNIEVLGKKVAVVGRSRLAGSPIASVLRKRGAQVEVCHKETLDTEAVCKSSDVLVSAAGQPSLITKDFVNSNQVVIDVGINRVNASVVGDVDFEEVEPIVKAITPVPGGVGPLTVACLFENLLDLCYNKS